MRDLMGVIYTSKNDLTLRELTASRAIAALPVAGRYRVIDFILSNLVNTGVRNVGVIMQKNYHSLMDHLGSGKEWDLHTRNNGLFILPPFLTRENVGTYGGILDALRSNMGYLRRSKQEYVILTGGKSVFNTRFDELFQQHLDSGADITLMYVKAKPEPLVGTESPASQKVYIGVDENHLVTDLEVSPVVPSYTNQYTDVMVLKKSLLIHLVDQAYAHSMHDLNRDLLQQYIRNGVLRVNGYEYKGYYRQIESVLSYFRFNMDLLDYNIRRELFMSNPVYTKVRDEVPAIYEEGAQASNSLVADGCIIEGSVENSVLFRGVRVGRGAKIKNCILMQDTDVRENVELENVITDKVVTFHPNGRLIGQPQYPIVIAKNTTL
ncbi:MAG TPA: glucose-1-phosphate adenylyltransferase subunit GlgD [Candidatus Faecaligallichristensenella faecipullorum]|nr:glucose-1-phosphate adenylyltransferase subunit GlgD [Candidatus Faecaligallichristensenella faecipullorum]